MSDTPVPPDPSAELNALLSKARQLTADIEAEKLRVTQLASTASEEISKAQTSSTSSNSTIQRLLEKISESEKKFTELSTTADGAHLQLKKKQEDIVADLNAIEKSRAAAEEASNKIAELKDSSQSQRDAAVSALEEISETKGLLEKLATESRDSRDALAKREAAAADKISAVEKNIQALTDQETELKTIVDNVAKLRTNAQENSDAIAGDSATVTEMTKKFEELKNSSEAAHAALEESRKQTLDKISEIGASYDEVMKQRSTLLEDKNVDGVITKAVATEISDANAQIKKLLEETKTSTDEMKNTQSKLVDEAKSAWDGDRADFKQQLAELIQQSGVQVDNLKTSLENEIRSLLPDAGAAGLSSAYVEAKSGYGPIKFQYTGSREGRYWHKYLGSWMAHVIRNYAASVVFYAMFIGPIGVFAWFFYDLLDFFKHHPEKFDPSLFLLRVGISIPLLTLSWFGWNSIRLHRQLFEEYNHKQRVMQLYDSFKKEIEKSGTDEQQKLLLGIMLTTVADKPSLAMHKYEKGIESLIPAINLGNIGSILGVTKETPQTTPPA